MEDLIARYGYAGIVTGTFFEGETILVAAGFLAHQGYLKLPWVILCASVGTLAGDQLYFHIGRIRGAAFLDKRPLWARKTARIQRLIDGNRNLVILGFRFLYGARTVAPFLIGVSRVSAVRFFLLNAPGGLAWAVTVGMAGYLLGRSVEVVLEEARRYEMWVLALLGAVGLVVWSFVWWRRHDRQRIESQITE